MLGAIWQRLRRKPERAFSVVINTVNRADSLDRTLRGLEKLRYTPFEVVVVNGPSTDTTEDVLRRWSPRLRIGRCPEATLGRSRNIGIGLAAGEIVAFIDDDAVPRPDWLYQLNRGYDDDAVAAVGGYTYDPLRKDWQWKVCSCTADGVVTTDTPGPFERYHGRAANPFLYLPGCNMSFRRSVLSEVGGFDDRLKYIFDDADIGRRIQATGRRIVSRQQAVVDHYVASNAARDGERIVRNPRALMHDFCLFVLQDAAADGMTLAEAQAQAWRAEAKRHLAGGVFGEDDHRLFLARIDEGLREGLAASARPRPLHDFSDPHGFLPFAI